MDPKQQASPEGNDSAQDKPGKALPDWLSKWHKMHDKLQGTAPENPDETAAEAKKKTEGVRAAKAAMKAEAKARIIAKEAALRGKDSRLELMETVRDLFTQKAADARGEKPQTTPNEKIVKTLIDKGADVNATDAVQKRQEIPEKNPLTDGGPAAPKEPPKLSAPERAWDQNLPSIPQLPQDRTAFPSLLPLLPPERPEPALWLLPEPQPEQEIPMILPPPKDRATSLGLTPPPPPQPKDRARFPGNPRPLTPKPGPKP